MKKYLVNSWPAAPHENSFIDNICEMFMILGMRVQSQNPKSWKTILNSSDLYVIHWPEAVFWGARTHRQLWLWILRVLANLIVLKLQGTKILWFVHNLEPHILPTNRRQAWIFYSVGLSKIVDGWITLSPSTALQVIQHYPYLKSKANSFIWHPPYPDTYAGDSIKAREELGLSEDMIVFGHAGVLRPNKNLEKLVELFGESDFKDAELLLTGVVRGEVERELEPLVGKVRAFNLQNGRLTPYNYDRALKAMDIFVAPYTGFLHSGALIHALCRGCVVVAPRAPFTEDLERAVGKEWVILYDNDILESAVLARARESVRGKVRLFPDLKFMDPSNNIEKLRALLSEMGCRLPLQGNRF